jgi:hypothetical protein
MKPSGSGHDSGSKEKKIFFNVSNEEVLAQALPTDFRQEEQIRLHELPTCTISNQD